MRVSLLERDDPRWTNFLRNVRHDFYHLPAYAEVVARLDHGKACAVLAEGDAEAMLMPLVIRRLPGEFGDFWDGASPYGYANPLYMGDAQEGDHLGTESSDAIVENLRAAGCVSLFVRSHPLISGMLLPRESVRIHHGETVYCQLTRCEAELWAQMRKGHRADVRRAERHGFEVALERQPDDLGSFEELYLRTMERVEAKSMYKFERSYFEGMRIALGQSLILAQVRKGAALAAAGLFVSTNGIVEYHLSASTEEFARYAPTKLMLNVVRRWAALEGSEVLHLGGGLGGRNDQLFEFKAGFASGRAAFVTVRIVVNADVYRKASNGLIGSVPRSGSGAFFPAYRAAP